MALVRVLLFAALGIIVAALVAYAIKRDQRYLRFIWQVMKYTLFLLLAVLLWFAGVRLFTH